MRDLVIDFIVVANYLYFGWVVVTSYKRIRWHQTAKAMIRAEMERNGWEIISIRHVKGGWEILAHERTEHDAL